MDLPPPANQPIRLHVLLHVTAYYYNMHGYMWGEARGGAKWQQVMDSDRMLKRRALPNRATGENLGSPRQKWCFPAKKVQSVTVNEEHIVWVAACGSHAKGSRSEKFSDFVAVQAMKMLSRGLNFDFGA